MMLSEMLNATSLYRRSLMIDDRRLSRMTEGSTKVGSRIQVLAEWNVQCSQSVEFRMFCLEGWIEGKKVAGRTRMEMDFIPSIHSFV